VEFVLKAVAARSHAGDGHVTAKSWAFQNRKSVPFYLCPYVSFLNGSCVVGHDHRQQAEPATEAFQNLTKMEFNFKRANGSNSVQ
jgi:hypothetical protein